MDELAFAQQYQLSLPSLWSARDAVLDGSGYKVERARKRRGGYREVFVPEPSVDTMLTVLRNGLSALYIPPECAHGYIRGRSIVSNAKPHCGHDVLLNLDLRNFFPSIGRDRVESMLMRFGAAPDLTALVCDLALVRDWVPAGFPTSPVISNMVFLEMDFCLMK